MYEERVLVFIDILGFSDAISKTIKNGKEVEKETEKISNLLGGIYSTSNHHKKNRHSFHKDSKIVSHFSDTIIISYSLRDDNAIHGIFNDISDMQLSFILFGCLFRGAIVMDKVYHTKDKIYGPAMVRAYQLERKMAIYPRIIIDDTISDEVSKYLEEKENIKLSNLPVDGFIRRDFDGQYFFNYFDTIKYAADGIDDPDVAATLTKVKKIFINNLNNKIKELEQSDDLSKKSKCLWLKEKCKEAIGGGA